MQKPNISENMELCMKIFMAWILNEHDNPSMEYKKEDKEFIEESFTAKILLKKFEVFGIKIHLPIYLLIILAICVNENPGQVQIVLKDLLLNIKSRKGPIPEGYIIKADDFAYCFEQMPLMENPEINEKYHKLWDAQKKSDVEFPESDNLCDTPEWWLEVME